MDYELIDGDYDILPNRTLAQTMQKDLEIVGGVTYTPEETEFAKKIQATFAYKVPPVESVAKLDTLSATEIKQSASSDVRDVSWNVPTVAMGAATSVARTTTHTCHA